MSPCVLTARPKAAFPETLPILPPTGANLSLALALAEIVGWRNQRCDAFNLHQDEMLLFGRRAAPPIKLIYLFEPHPFLEDHRNTFEAVAFAREGINDVDLYRRILPQVGDRCG